MARKVGAVGVAVDSNVGTVVGFAVGSDDE